MMTIIRPPGIGYVTTRLLAEKLRGDHGIDCRIATADRAARRAPGDVVPWGQAHPGAVVNRRIGLASNKRLSRQAFQKAGVPIPRPWNGRERPFFPMVARPDHHHHGNDFYVVRDDAELRRCPIRHGTGYYSAMFDKTHEFRAHCGHGKVMFLEDKQWQPEQGVAANQHQTRQRWRVMRWSEIRELKLKPVLQAALDAMDAVGLDFGAVDVMYNIKRKDVAVLETNTAPTVTGPYENGKYARYLAWLAKGSFNRDHWPHKGYTATASFFWKERQFE